MEEWALDFGSQGNLFLQGFTSQGNSFLQGLTKLGSHKLQYFFQINETACNEYFTPYKMCYCRIMQS